jgi:hypothetical protein
VANAAMPRLSNEIRMLCTRCCAPPTACSITNVHGLLGEALMAVSNTVTTYCGDAA